MTRRLWPVAIALFVAAVATGEAAPQGPTFRAGADVIAVEVQVVASNGQPLVGLTADKFEVSINRRRRKVVSAEVVRVDAARLAGPAAAPASIAPAVMTAAAPNQPGRTFMLIIDEGSFQPSQTVGVRTAVREFIGKLQPADTVGLFAFPGGTQTMPTTDRQAVSGLLDRVMGTRMALSSGDRFRLTISDVADLSTPEARKRAEERSQGATNLEIRKMAEICRNAGEVPGIDCYRQVMDEARRQALLLEGEAGQSLGNLRGALGELGKMPGRKTAVLVSAGLVISDRPGGPDLRGQGVLVGQEAARANAVVYSLFIDSRRMEDVSAASGRFPRITDEPARNSQLLSQPLMEVSAASGGALMTAVQGYGELALDRVLTETSAYYLIGVEPDNADRDGKPRELSVKVNAGQRGVSVRSRSWVVVPPRSAAPEPPRAAATPAKPAEAPRSRLAVSESSRRAAAGAAASAVPPRDPSLDPLLSSVGAYITRFVSEFVDLIGEERYTQDVVAGGSLLARPTAPATGPTHRELKSDFLIVRTDGPLEWVSFRDVYEVDGKPVREREERLSKLFSQPAATAMEQAARIAQEGARFNIGAVERTVNTPVLPLLFLRAELQPRFRFSRGAATSGFSGRVLVLNYQEIGQPTIIRTVRDTDRPASGRFWIDQDTGRVLQSELVLTGSGVEVRFTTLYQADDRLGISVPAWMREEYLLPSGRLTGTATYAAFRRFEVKTESGVAQPPVK